MQKEIRSLLFKQQQRNADQQIGVCGGLIQRNGKIVLYSADTVKHRISMGKKGIAGLLQRSAAGQIMIKRFAILRVLFFIVCGKLPDFFCNQVASPLQFFQQKRRAELRHRADISTVKAAIHHQLQRFTRCAIEGGQFKQVINPVRYHHS